MAHPLLVHRDARAGSPESHAHVGLAIRASARLGRARAALGRLQRVTWARGVTWRSRGGHVCVCGGG
eukprot:5665147-Prymnesium_polylepis.1